MKPRIKLPDVIRVGEVIEIRALAHHVMETGNRRDASGTIIPRNIIHTFKVTFEGKPVFSAELGSGISANPYIAFHMRVPGPGELEFTWIDDKGETLIEKVPLAIGGSGQ
jgi:sulfur-oxidizing protein SoxZ